MTTPNESANPAAASTAAELETEVSRRDALYGGSVTMLAVSLKKFGIDTSFVDATDPHGEGGGFFALHGRGHRAGRHCVDAYMMIRPLDG